MALSKEVASETVETVRFSFMTADEVRRHSVVKVTNAILLDQMNRPTPFGLYDPAFGPMEYETKCKTCGERELYCPGHCGHIDLVYPVYHPLMFNFLHNILQTTCFFCLHFRTGRDEVERCVSQLRLVANGDVVGARRLNLESTSELSHPADSEGSHESCSTVHSVDKGHESEHLKSRHWSSLQLTEAVSVINKFLKPKQVKCKNCEAKNPKITKPTFGWLVVNGMPSSHARENVIRGCTMTESISGEDRSEVDDSNNMNSCADDFEISEKETIYADFAGAKNRGKKGHKKKNSHVPLEFTKLMSSSPRALLPSEVKNIVMHLWENEFELCTFISDIQQHGLAEKVGHNMFFLETILVPPIKFRAPTKGGDSVMEHPQTVLLTKVLQSNISLGNANTNNAVRSNIVINRWRDLQFSINVLFDSKTASGRKDMASGICQLLEKKEGLFRQKMMGKRVNFACRSVISPDPYLAVNEIGIPPYFALRLTYPEKVTPWNIVKLREAILNGPHNHPGAIRYMDKLSSILLPSNRKDRFSISRRLPSSRGALMETGEYCGNEGKVVLRHLRDGDVVLVNRQPTLHKPSMMAHIVRVLKGEKTIRMHYANCSTYNADFDGDEMNVHFPQDEISRAEAYNIVNANNQYVRPSNGEPLRALIQDHIVSAVLLSVKDTFLTGNEFSQLLYGSGVSNLGFSSFSGKLGQGVCISSSREEMLPILPAIWKPIPLWTGKQVITAVLNHITRGRKPFTVEKATKVPRDFFQCRQSEMAETEREVNNEKEAGPEDKGGEVESQSVEFDEDKLMIFKNEFVRGVIDKAQFADYGLVHTVQELYGSNTAGVLLSVFSRLFTIYLQMHGFTCGVDDLLIRKDKDIARAKQLEDCERKVAGAYHKYFGGGDEIEIEQLELQLKIERTLRRGGEAALANLDRTMISILNENSSNGVLSELLSVGLVKPSGKNCISLMTTSGAKGSKVNFQQISSHLGQQELEGKRVPRMVSGKTLPCFLPWDWAARAGGFISDRFLTGLRPQEYYFHCMAGREGLVDTAVKTSRSGYLQRCLIKNLEGLKVSYDHTVRDADGSIVQFSYGEDGVDVHQTSFITKFETLEMNVSIISEKIQRQLVEVEDVISGKNSAQLEGAKDVIAEKNIPRLAEANGFIKKLPQGLQKQVWKYIKGNKKGRSSSKVEPEDFLELVKYKFFSCLAQPGEPVGVLAAQSVGEPSTQMTLNTFHLAGRGEMNVTLGIPRLQEILMLASNDIKTPVMTCPMHEGKTKDDALHLADKMKKITVADLVESMEVSVEPFAVHNNQICSIYKLMMTLHRCEGYPKYSGVTEKDWKNILEVVFLRELEDAIQNHLVLSSRISGIKNFMTDSRAKASDETDNDVPGSRPNGDENDGDDDESDDDKAEDLGLDAKKIKNQATDEVDYDNDSSEEEQHEGASPGGLDIEGQQPSNEDEMIDHDMVASDKKKDKLIENPSNLKNTSESELLEGITKLQDKRKKKEKFVPKETDRAIYVAARRLHSNKKSGLHFEVHFKFTNEPHILLAQIAQTTAQKVFIQNSGKVDKCRVTDCSENQVIYYGADPKDRKNVSIDAKKNIPALHTSGVDFQTFWKLQDQLDVRYLYSNNIHAMLNTYGVEAARETIIREISHVFNSYGIAVNIRHLTLIADFMTHSGGYRPMNRLGGIAESISPFSKMTFETASKFIVEAAQYGEIDNLETPSARICLGLPVKMGTGSFDLMQKLDIDVH